MRQDRMICSLLLRFWAFALRFDGLDPLFECIEPRLYARFTRRRPNIISADSILKLVNSFFVICETLLFALGERR